MDFVPVAAPEQAAALRRLLTARRFTTSDICTRLGIPAIYDFRSIREGRPAARAVSDALDLLIRLFMDVELVERATLEALLSADECRLLDEMGLILTREDGRCHASVLLYPTGPIWIASDLNADPAETGHAVLREDAVYPAITKNTRHFLGSLPPTPCARFLELCAGTGIAALLASQYAEQTWATDITDRATRFARFNAVLNGIENCTVLQSDLFAAVAGQSFDRIVAHPPYMPSLQQKYVFRDGGEDGEQITRGIVSALPSHLSRGGSFYCTCILTDRKDLRAEQRLRRLLGEWAGEFDIILLTHQSFQPTEYYFQMALAGRVTLDEVQRRHEIFRRLEVERLLYGSVQLRRHDGLRPAYTARRQAGPATGLPELDWLDRWESAASAPQGVLDMRPTVPAECRMNLSHAPAGGAWVVESCVLTTAWPFQVEAKCPPWTASFLNRCDGHRSVRDHLDWLRAEGLVSAEAPEADFAVLARTLVAGGFLELPAFPLPRPSGAGH